METKTVEDTNAAREETFDWFMFVHSGTWFEKWWYSLQNTSWGWKVQRTSLRHLKLVIMWPQTNTWASVIISPTQPYRYTFYSSSALHYRSFLKSVLTCPISAAGWAVKRSEADSGRRSKVVREGREKHSFLSFLSPHCLLFVQLLENRFSRIQHRSNRSCLK